MSLTIKDKTCVCNIGINIKNKVKTNTQKPDTTVPEANPLDHLRRVSLFTKGSKKYAKTNAKINGNKMEEIA